MHVVISKFTVGAAAAEPVRAAFRDRPHAVDAAPGFLRLEVLEPEDVPGQFWLTTWWERREDFDRRYRSHAFKASHDRVPRDIGSLIGTSELIHLRSSAS
jgi:heme-degrading monooxygenase HmoA